MRKFRVYLLFSILIFSVIQVTSAQAVTEEHIFSDMKTSNIPDLSTYFPEGKLLGGLDQYMDDGISPVNSFDDRVIVISSSIDTIGDTNYLKAPIGENYLHFMPTQTPNQVRTLALDPNVIYVMPDTQINQTRWREDTLSLMSTGSTSGISLDSFVAKDTIGTERVWDEFNITGDGITIGVVDSGVDFGISDLYDAAVYRSTGFTANFDGTQQGITFTSLELSPVSKEGSIFLELEDENIEFRRPEVGDFSTTDDNGIILKDLEIAGIEKPSVSGKYQVGIMFQQSFQQDVPTQIILFFLSDSERAGVYDTLYADLDTSLAISLAYNGIIFENGDTYLSLADWSVSDEVYFDKDNAIVARDITGDGVNDISAGSLGSSYQQNPNTGEIDMIHGIHSSGTGLVMIYDSVGHGTLSGASAASQGDTPFPVFDDVTTEEVESNTTYYLPGSAPGAKIIATKALTLSQFIMGMFWMTGLEPGVDGSFSVINTDHLVDISSNSWGTAVIANEGTVKGMDLLSMLVDLFSHSGSLYSGYPGVIHVMSSGNGGPGSGTVATPATASMGIAVGASNSFQFLNNSGKNDVSWFTARGPTPYGLIKPDLVAPGNTGFTLTNLVNGYGNGTYASTTFGGTSESAPRVSGVIALMMQAMKENAILRSLGNIRTILKSTAVDLGFHPTAQGAGLVDAYAAVSAIYDGDQIIFSSTHSAEMAGQRLQAAFLKTTGLDHPLYNNPIPDALISLTPEDLEAGVTISISYANGTDVDLSGYNSMVERMQLSSQTSFSFSSRSGESTSINLGSVLPANWREAAMLQLSLSLDQDTWDGLSEWGLSTPDMLLYDEGSGRYIYDIITQRSWVQQLYAGYPDNDFSGTPSLVFADPGFIEEIPEWQAMNYQALAQVFVYEEWDLVNVTSSTGSITLEGDVPDIFQFFSFTLDSNDLGLRIPLLISPIEEVGFGDDAEPIDTDLDIQVPYDLDESYGSFDWGYRPESGDFRFYNLQVPESASYLALHATWDDEYFLPDIFVFNSTGDLVANTEVEYIGGGIYDSQTSEEKAQNLLIPADDEYYVVLVHLAQFSFSAGPALFHLTPRYLLGDIPSPVTTFSKDIEQVLGGNLNISTEPYILSDFPELYLSGVSTEVYQGRNGSLKDSVENADLVEGIAESPASIEYFTLLEFEKGEKVNLRLSWEQKGLIDADFFVIGGSDSFSIENDLLSGQGASPGAEFEYASFAASESGFYQVFIDFVLAAEDDLDFDFTLEYESRDGPDLVSDRDYLVLDTRLFPNGSYGLNIIFHTNFGLEFEDHALIELENHPIFTGSLLSPGDGSEVSRDVTVSWTSSKPVYADIYLRYDSVEYNLARDLTGSEFSFDSRLHANGAATLVLVLSDGIYSLEFEVSITIDNAFPSTLPPTETANTSLPASWLLMPVALFAMIYIRLRKE